MRVVAVALEQLTVSALQGPSNTWRVRNALPPGVEAEPGDEVVVLDCAQGPVAIACVRSAAKASMRLADGTAVETDADRTRVRVRRSDGTELFNYDVRSGSGTITVERESVSLVAKAGDLQLKAAGEILLSGRSVRACAAMPAGRRSAVVVGPRKVAIETSALRWDADVLEVAAQKTQVWGRELRTSIARVMLEVERLETVSDVVQQTARTVYAHVRELCQQRAGSLRTLVDGTAQLRAREVAHRTDDAYKIRAEKIHLG